MAPLSVLECPAMHLSVPSTFALSRAQVPPEVQHCAAMMLSGAPLQEVVVSLTPGLRHPRTLVPALPPWSTRTPPAGIIDGGSDELGGGGDGLGGGGTGGGGSGDSFGGGGDGGDVLAVGHSSPE